MVTFKLTVMTLERIVFEDDVISFSAPGADGYFQVLAHHAAIIAALQPGKLSITEKDGKKQFYAVSGGFVEVAANQAWVLPDAIEEESKIDIQRAEKSYKKTKELLDANPQGIDLKNLKLALRRAENRIKIHHEFMLKTSHTIENL